MPLFDLFIAMLWFFLFIAWIWLLISVYADVFRSEDLGGGAKAAWVLFVLVTPYIGVFIYLIVRGGDMQDRAAEQARAAQRAAEARIREVAGTTSTADEIAKLVTLRDQGTLSSEEFDSQKVKLLA
jgi:type VI protein secretion system component VasK